VTGAWQQVRRPQQTPTVADAVVEEEDIKVTSAALAMMEHRVHRGGARAGRRRGDRLLMGLLGLRLPVFLPIR
jgi:hypothetical protein